MQGGKELLSGLKICSLVGAKAVRRSNGLIPQPQCPLLCCSTHAIFSLFSRVDRASGARARFGQKKQKLKTGDEQGMRGEGSGVACCPKKATVHQTKRRQHDHGASSAAKHTFFGGLAPDVYRNHLRRVWSLARLAVGLPLGRRGVGHLRRTPHLFSMLCNYCTYLIAKAQAA
jgi:hypothetical protein